MSVSQTLAEQHYAVHQVKPFYEPLVKYITSGPVVVMAWEGSKAIEAIRQTVGATNPTNAAPGTLRADLAIDAPLVVGQMEVRVEAVHVVCPAGVTS